MIEFINFVTEFTVNSQAGGPSATFSPCHSGRWGGVWLGVTCPRAPCTPVLRAPLCSVPCGLSVRAAALLAFPSPPAPLLTELFYPTQVVNDAWSPGRWSRRLVGGDVPMPSLTRPPPWEDASQSPNQVTALQLRALSQCPWGEK